MYYGRINTYIPELISSMKNMILIKCSDYLKIKNIIFNLNSNNTPGMMVLVIFFYHSC